MKITVDKTDYRVKFFHTYDSDSPVFGRDRFVSRPKRSTICEIWAQTEELTLTPDFVGVAGCDTHDHFVRATGRKVALAKAIESFEKPDRKQFWEGYWNSLGSKVRR